MKAAGIRTRISNHTFPATGITAYLKNGGTLEKAAMIANHASTRTTQLYDRRTDEVSLDEIRAHPDLTVAAARPTALSCFGMNTLRSRPNRHGLGQKPPDRKCFLKHMIMPDGLLALIPIGAPVE